MMSRTLERARTRRMGLTAALMAVAVSVVALLNASPASAAAPDGTRFISNVGTGWELSANFGDGTTGAVYTVAPSDSIYHSWFIEGGNGVFINNGTKQCLSSNYGDGTTGKVYTVPCSGVVFQNWKRVAGWDNQSWNIVNVGTGWCLSTNFSGAVYTVRCSGVIYHSWRIN